MGVLHGVDIPKHNRCGPLLAAERVIDQIFSVSRLVTCGVTRRVCCVRGHRDALVVGALSGVADRRSGCRVPELRFQRRRRVFRLTRLV